VNRARLNPRSVAFGDAVGGKVAATFPVVRVVGEGGYYDPDTPYSAQLEINYPASNEVGAIVYLNHRGDRLLRGQPNLWIARPGQIYIDENQDPVLRAAAEVLDMALAYQEASRRKSLPQASEEQTRIWVEEAIAETGATSMRDMGKVMGILMERHRGAIDGRVANAIVRSLLW
jgi:hypothetical protein